MQKHGTFTRRDDSFQEMTREKTLHREFLGTFDALVRGLRTGTSGTTQIAHRLRGMWEHQSSWTLMLHADALELEGERLRSDDKQGAWILPTFMAGVRSIKLLGGASTDDVVRLAFELAMLELDEDALSGFRDWLWSDGAEGWKVETHMSFMEMMEVASSLDGMENRFGAMRASVMLSMDQEPAEISSRELDAAALLPEFGLSIEVFTQGHHLCAFDTHPAELQVLRTSVEDLSRWAWAELDMVLECASMHGAVPAERIASRLLSALAHDPDAPLLRRVRELFDDPQGYLLAVIASLLAEGLTRTLATKTFEDDAFEESWLLYQALDADARASWWTHMLRHNNQDGLRRFVARQPRVWEALSLESLTEAEAHTLYEAFEQAGSPDATRQEYVRHCPPPIQASLLAMRLTDALHVHRSLLEELMVHDSDIVARRLVPALLRHDPRLAIAWGHIASGRKRAWPRDVMRSLFEALLLSEEGAALMSSFVGKRRWDVGVRDLALTLLIERGDVRHLKEATRWRFFELFEPVTFTQKLREQRIRFRKVQDAG